MDSRTKVDRTKAGAAATATTEVAAAVAGAAVF